jgi:hypothetical protein
MGGVPFHDAHRCARLYEACMDVGRACDDVPAESATAAIVAARPWETPCHHCGGGTLPRLRGGQPFIVIAWLR